MGSPIPRRAANAQGWSKMHGQPALSWALIGKNPAATPPRQLQGAITAEVTEILEYKPAARFCRESGEEVMTTMKVAVIELVESSAGMEPFKIGATLAYSNFGKEAEIQHPRTRIFHGKGYSVHSDVSYFNKDNKSI